MKNNLRFMVVGLVLSAGVALSAEVKEPVFKWGNLLTGLYGQDQNSGIAVSGKDGVYWLSVNGSKTGDTDVTYDGSLLYDGSVYEGTSANKNLTLLKTDADGKKEWVIYSNAGDFISGEGKVAVNSRGEVVLFGSVRHTDGYYDKGINLVDAKGKNVSLNWEVGNKRNNRLFLVTASPDGEILWAKTFQVSTDPAKAASGNYATFTADAVNAYAMTIDADDNIYIGGRYRNPLTFNKADGSPVVLNPKNVSTWNGDPQKVCGDMYVVKLDANGNYISSLQESGDEVNITYTWDLQYYGGSVYFVGYTSSAAENSSLKIGNISVIPNRYVCPIVARLDANLNVTWLKLLPGDAVATKNAVQNVGISVSGKAVWLAGMYNGKISDPVNEDKYVASTQGTLREGFIIKLDAATGEWMASANSRTAFPQNYLTGYLKVITEEETGTGNILVYGYAMNATVGAFLRSYDAATLAGNVDESWNIVTQGGVPTAVAIAYVPELGAAYVTVRGNKAFQPLGGTLSDNITGYTNYLARFDLPVTESGVTDIEYANMDGIEDEIEYYNLQGVKVTSPSAPGIYLRRSGGKTLKVMIR